MFVYIEDIKDVKVLLYGGGGEKKQKAHQNLMRLLILLNFCYILLQPLTSLRYINPSVAPETFMFTSAYFDQPRTV